jgi:hypothetical protein
MQFRQGTAYQHEIEQQRSYMRFFILTKLAAQPNSRALDIHHDIARERRWNASFSSLVKEKLIEKTVHGYYDQPPLWAVTDAGRAYLKPKPKPPQAKPTSPNWRANKSRSLRRKAAKKRAAMGLDASRPCV